MLHVMKFRIEGTAPLLMHNGQLADPSTEWAREIRGVSSKRNKTDEDHAELARLEFLGGLYINGDGEVAIPADVILGCVVKGAKQFKLGPKFNAGVFEVDQFSTLIYDGPTDPMKLYETGAFVDRRSVVIGRVRVMRTRPIFQNWALEFGLNVNADVIDPADVEKAVVRAGEVIGMGDYRPRYGRFVTSRL